MQHTISKTCVICEGPLGSSASRRGNHEMRMCFICKKSGAPDEYRCEALTTTNRRCKHWAIIDGKKTTRCKTHEVKK